MVMVGSRRWVDGDFVVPKKVSEALVCGPIPSLWCTQATGTENNSDVVDWVELKGCYKYEDQGYSL